QRRGPFERRAHGLERTLPGLGRRRHQDRDDPARPRARGAPTRLPPDPPGPRRARARVAGRGSGRCLRARARGDGGRRGPEGPAGRRGRFRTGLALGEVVPESLRYTFVNAMRGGMAAAPRGALMPPLAAAQDAPPPRATPAPAPVETPVPVPAASAPSPAAAAAPASAPPAIAIPAPAPT